MNLKQSLVKIEKYTTYTNSKIGFYDCLRLPSEKGKCKNVFCIIFENGKVYEQWVASSRAVKTHKVLINKVIKELKKFSLITIVYKNKNKQIKEINEIENWVNDELKPENLLREI